MAFAESKFIWMNGKLVDWKHANVHVLTHALHYGTGVFEGIRCYSTPEGPAVFRLTDHIKRLLRSATAFKMKIPYSAGELIAAIKETVSKNGLDSCYIRPIAYFGYSDMGLYPLKNPVDVAIACWRWGTYLGEEGLKNGIRVKISSIRRHHPSIIPPDKKICGGYVNSAIAKIEAKEEGYDECLLLNLDGTVSEGPGENIFLVKDGMIKTPSLDSGILEGITRASIIEIANDLGYKTREEKIKPEDVCLADELFFTGTAAEVTPIREVDGKNIGNGSRGPITEKLQSAFFEIVNGKNKKYAKWLELVKG